MLIIVNFSQQNYDHVHVSKCKLLFLLPTIVPTIASENADMMELFPGENVAVSSEFRGIPYPSLNWSRDGVPLKDGADGVTIMTTGNTSVLTVTDSRGQSGGQYRVNASNVAGFSSLGFTVECT